MSDKEEARKSRAEEHKKLIELIERLNLYDIGPRDHDAEEAERERLLLFVGFDPDDPRNGG